MMRAFADLYYRLDETTRTLVKQQRLAAALRRLPAADAAWVIALFLGRRPPRLCSTRELSRWCAAESGWSDWLFEECYATVGDLAETIALIFPRDNNFNSPSEESATAIDATSLPVEADSLAAWMDQLQHWRRLSADEQRSTIIAAWRRLDPASRFVFNKLMTGGFRVGVSEGIMTRAIAEAFALPVETVAERLKGNWQPTAAFFADLIDPCVAARPTNRPYPFCLARPLPGTSESAAEVDDSGRSSLPEIAGEEALHSDAARIAGVTGQGPDATTAELRTAGRSTDLDAWEVGRLLGERRDWIAEWKWDGIRAQLIRREGNWHLWSRGEELITDRFPELAAAALALPDGCVLDGELVGWKAGRVLPFLELQKRITRKTVGRKILADVPARFLAFDLLEEDGVDQRERTTAERRQRLEELLPTLLVLPNAPDEPGEEPRVVVPRPLPVTSWDELAHWRSRSRELGVEGLMLKQTASRYEIGRTTGTWWKWKVAPLTVDAVLIYAQKGHGRRANLFSDYTFAVWDGPLLVPIAKAYSGLTDDELREVDRFVRSHARESFGPVTSVTPELVFELAFEGIQRSARHKSGIAVRFPRMLRWRRDKTIADIDQLSDLHRLLEAPTVPKQEPR